MSLKTEWGKALRLMFNFVGRYIVVSIVFNAGLIIFVERYGKPSLWMTLLSLGVCLFGMLWLWKDCWNKSLSEV